MSKRKFDYMEFHYGNDSATLFDSGRYTREEAINQFCRDYYLDYKTILDEEKIKVEEEYVKWKPNLSKEEIWHFDLEEKQGMYITCNKEVKRAFKCWKVLI